MRRSLTPYEYVEKPLEVDIIKETAKRAIEAGEIRDEDDIITAALLGTALQDDIIGKSDSVKALFRRIGELIKSPLASPILITGEIGTGKELIAKTIHSKSKESASSPFISVSCGALSEEELYTLLFGSGKIKGKLEEVGNGTLYLGESSKMSERIRSKMLSIMDNKEFRIDGSEAIEFHGRIIASLTVNMDGDIKLSDRSNDDLQYRLSANMLKVPALRERREDLPLIAIQEMLKSAERSGKKLRGISNEFIERLSEYDFPGNIRELKNIIGEAVIRSRSNLLTIGDLPESFAAETQGEGISVKTGKKKEDEAIKDGSRGLMAIFFADMVGYTTLMQKDEIEARNLIELMRTTMKPIIRGFRRESPLICWRWNPVYL